MRKCGICFVAGLAVGAFVTMAYFLEEFFAEFAEEA